MTSFLQEPPAGSRIDELADDIRSAIHEAAASSMGGRRGHYEEVWVESNELAVDLSTVTQLVDQLLAEARRVGVTEGLGSFARFAGMNPDREYKDAMSPHGVKAAPNGVRPRDHTPAWHRRRWWRTRS